MTPLHHDLEQILQLTGEVERDLFAQLSPEVRSAAPDDGGWSARDVRTHLAAWRSIEARRLRAAAGDAGATSGDPGPHDETDAANQALSAARRDWDWDRVERDAEASIVELLAAIRDSTFDALCECDDQVAGIGANGANHAIGHLSDVARLAGQGDRFARYLAEVEAVLRRGHLPPRDSGVMLYNAACHDALSGDLDAARSRLRAAISRRSELAQAARDDADLVALRDEIEALSAG